MDVADVSSVTVLASSSYFHWQVKHTDERLDPKLRMAEDNVTTGVEEYLVTWPMPFTSCEALQTHRRAGEVHSWPVITKWDHYMVQKGKLSQFVLLSKQLR